MQPPAEPNVTRLLVEWRGGNEAALDLLLPFVYNELRRLAGNYLRRERGNHTLQPTALINEVYVRLVDQHMPEWQGRAHFFGVAAQLMRQILVDSARKFRSQKRGGTKFSLDDNAGSLAVPQASVDVLALDEALTKLAAFDERKARAVEMKYFGGLKIDEIAVALDISEPTVTRDLRSAEAWLRKQITERTST
jgi:RNA polymerase sigma-70 factor, ECF subfamily